MQGNDIKNQSMACQHRQLDPVEERGSKACNPNGLLTQYCPQFSTASQTWCYLDIFAY